MSKIEGERRKANDEDFIFDGKFDNLRNCSLGSSQQEPMTFSISKTGHG